MTERLGQPNSALVFVYNADSGLFNALSDIAHKAFSPRTYQCNLCALTHSNFGMRKGWKLFLETLDAPFEFLHADELAGRYAVSGVPLPAIFERIGDGLRLWIAADAINACRTTSDLERLIHERLADWAQRHVAPANGAKGEAGRMQASEQVILVDERDRELGASDKLRAHAEGALHRAFSVFVFDCAGRLLLQRRAREKYHSGGLWSNTCCGHPRPGEETSAGARRRLREEMNFDCELREAFGFVYRAELDNALVEHEYDHVFVGEFEGSPAPDPSEVEQWKWVAMDELRRGLREEPSRYSYWLKMVVEGGGWPRLDALMRGG